MSVKVQRQKHQRPTATAKRRQALLVRAVVGSLVLCAALAPPAVSQTGGAQDVYRQNAAPEVKEFRSINTRPLRDVLEKTRALIEAGELSVGDAFDFTIEADRNADGSLKAIRFAKAHNETHARWKPVVEEFITALSESGALSSLQEARRLSIRLKLNGGAAATLHASLDSEERADALAQSHNALADFWRLGRRGGREGVEILNNMAFSANGKQLTMQLEMTREMVGNLLRKHLSLP
ncbi:MAG TPA: hypothetical protein VEZ40_02190 [Pyrinomonadaceae bacterium]|nr:hypothetical protein [Pyrinomonadaceae bacterium]